MVVMKVFFIVMAVLLVVCVIMTFVLGYFLSAYMVHPDAKSLEWIREYETNAGFWRDYDSFPKEEYQITMKDGYTLQAEYVPANVESDRYVIITHGYTANRYSSLKYLHMYRDMGFSCVIYDNRGHGANERCVCKMGLTEANDLLEVIEDTKKRFGNHIRLGLHGESMGSAMTVFALGEKPNVEFAVVDCGFADLRNVIQKKMKTLFHLPGFLCYPASLMCKLCFGYWVGEVQPIRALETNQVPVCFMHGEADDFIVCENSGRMQEATKGYSEIHLFPNARHAESIAVDETGYRRITKEFLSRCKMLDE